MICLSLTESTIKENSALLGRYRRFVGLVELRADWLKPDQRPLLAEFPRRVDLPVILTIRRRADGGRWEGNESERLALYQSQIDSGYAYFDLEEDLPPQEWESRWNLRGTTIRSFHDFEGTLENLAKRILSLPRSGKEIPKGAVMPRSSRDCLRIFAAAEKIRLSMGDAGKWLLVGMGNYGFPTRILAEWMGGWFTFASPEGRSAAPGHLDPKRLETLYRYSRIRRGIPLYGIIGQPVMHSRSPELHNRGLTRIGQEGVYLPMETDAPAEILPWAKEAGFRGLSVTAPHKEGILPLLKERDPSVTAIGSCNTLVTLDGGGWRGVNTDAVGFLQALEEGLGGKVRGFKAAVIGAGGAARAVVYALVSAGAEVTVHNRTVERARKLSGEFACGFAPLGDLGMGGTPEIIVQASSGGMQSLENPTPADPIPHYEFQGSETLFELVYAPAKTPLLLRAEAAGCRVIPGMRMLERQGWEQFRLFTGQSYPQ